MPVHIHSFIASACTHGRAGLQCPFSIRAFSGTGVSPNANILLFEWSRGSDAGLSRVRWSAGVVEWLMAPGCKPGGLRLYEGSNPSPSTIMTWDCNKVETGLDGFPGEQGGRSAMVAH